MKRNLFRISFYTGSIFALDSINKLIGLIMLMPVKNLFTKIIMRGLFLSLIFSFQAKSELMQSSEISDKGTSDTGGANGVNGVVFEYSAKDITTLESYKKRLKPIIDQLTELYKTKYEEKDFTSGKSIEKIEKTVDFEELFKLKNWYITSVDFKPISNKILGLDFLKEPTEQLAYQTQNEIWINEKYFEELKPELLKYFEIEANLLPSHEQLLEAQAYLIMHEYVMNLYMLKLMSFDEYCELFMKAGLSEGENCKILPESIKDMVTGFEGQRELVIEDYENIRRVTVWLMRNVMNSNSKIVEGIFLANGFHNFLFELKDYASYHFENGHWDNTFEITPDQLALILKKYFYANSFSQECKSSDKKIKISCSIQFTSQDENILGEKMKSFVFKLINKSNNSVIRQTKLIYNPDTKLQLQKFQLGFKKEQSVFLLNGYDYKILTTKSEGDVGDQLLMIFQSDQNSDKVKFQELKLSFLGFKSLIYTGEFEEVDSATFLDKNIVCNQKVVSFYKSEFPEKDFLFLSTSRDVEYYGKSIIESLLSINQFRTCREIVK